MKPILTKFLTAFFLLAQLACKKDDDIIIKENTFTASVKQNVALPHTITSKEGIQFDLTISSGENVRLKEATLSLNDVTLKTNAAGSEGEIDIQHTYKAKTEDIGQSLIFRLTISDEEGRSIDKDFIVYIESAPAEIFITIPSEAPVEIQDNETADFSIAVTSENDLKYIKTYLDQTEIASLTKETFAKPKEDAYQFVYQASAADADKTLIFTIEVMDILGNIKKQDYSLKVNRSATVDFNAYTSVELGAQNSAGAGPFLNTVNGEVYVTTGAAAKSAGIDLVTFYSGSSNAYNIVSPTLSSVAAFIYTKAKYGDDAIENWPVRNATSIKKVTLDQSEFDLIASSAEIEALYNGSSASASESSGGLTTNSVIVFKTAANKYGVLFVKAKSANANTGYLTVDIKVQK